MKQINPLYIALFLIAVMVVVMFKREGAIAMQQETRAELKKTEMMAKRIGALKKSWEAGEQTKKSLDRLLKRVSRTAKIEHKEQHDTIVITAKKIDAKTVSYMLNKLFNNTYVIKAMTIKRLDGKSASLEVEIML